jgi:methyl-accepting chemotaxis protein/methyl-accepting chemotaxis protein-1 (serine sensor receptor)
MLGTAAADSKSERLSGHRFHMTIVQKIALLYAPPVALVLAVGAVSIVNLRLMNGVIGKLANDSLPGTYSIGRLSGIAKDIRGGIRGHITSNTQADKLKAEADVAVLDQTLRQEIKEYQKSISNAHDRELFASVAGGLDKLLRTSDVIRPLSRAGKTEEALKRFRADTMPAYLQVQKAIEDVYAFKRQDGSSNAAEAVSSARSAERILWVLLGFSAPFCGLLGWFIVHGLHRTLHPMIRELIAASLELGGATRHLAASSDSLAQGATEQAASLEETSAAGEEIHSMTQQNLKKSQEAARLMADTAEAAAHASHDLEQTMEFMREMDASSGKVSKIIAVIDGLAFQTNILALNAAVEAARAGEAGLGFAVVADEVRSLAHRSAQAAKDTAELIRNSTGKSNQGCGQVERILVVVRKMSGSAGRVKTMVDEVSAASMEQARGIEQIAKAISQMDQVTQRTAASAEESASVGHELSSQTESLHAAIENLRLMAGTDARQG